MVLKPVMMFDYLHNKNKNRSIDTLEPHYYMNLQNTSSNKELVRLHLYNTKLLQANDTHCFLNNNLIRNLAHNCLKTLHVYF